MKKNEKRTHKGVYVRHLFYLPKEFSLGSDEKIGYVNMVKNPVEQFISWYYYERNGWQKSGVDPTQRFENTFDVLYFSVILHRALSRSDPPQKWPGPQKSPSPLKI